MIIGCDAKRAFFNFSGLGNYSRLLINSLSELYKDNLHLLFTPKFKTHPLHNFANNENCKIITPNRLFSLLPSSFWRSYSIVHDINQHKADIFHGLSGELPFSKLNISKVVTIHDLIFLRYPEYYAAWDRKMYEKKSKHACKVADRIIAISKQTADDCIKFLNADSKKIEVVYQSCDPIFFAFHKTDENIKEMYHLPQKFILCVGTIEARKNLLNLVQAMKFIDEDVSLVAIGRRTSYTNVVENFMKENNLEKRVILKHNVPFRDFPAIYAASSAFVYPSVFEGFGIPVLEALAIGTPVATSNLSSMPEVGGEAALYFDPYNVEDMAQKINLLLNDNEIVKQLNEKREKQLNKFSLNSIAKNVMEIYDSIL